jgi:small subunit ribosomal protein S20
MANTAAAKKEARASVGRTLRNRSVRSAVKTRVGKARRVITDGAEGALESVLTAISGLDRAAEKGILHPNNVARRKSRLMKRLNAQGAVAPAPAKGAKGKAASGAKKAARPAAKSAAKPAPKKTPARRTATKKSAS